MMDDVATSNMRAQLLRLMMSALDFRHALSAASFLLTDCDWSAHYSIEDIRRFLCYETTVVVAYGRPFAQARGHGPPFGWKLIKPQFQLESTEAVLHERLLDCRNRLYAHSDGDYTAIVPEIWRSQLPSGGHHDFLAIHDRESLVFSEEDVRSIHTFLWKIRHHLDDAVQKHPAPREGIPIVIRDLFSEV